MAYLLFQSFAAHDSCIVTQMPLPHTINDFWSLVLQENCQAIVILNELKVNISSERCLRDFFMNLRGF